MTALTLSSLSGSALAATPGTSASRSALAPAATEPLSPFFSDSGLISLSVDAIGTNNPAGGTVSVHKNAAGAMVRKAYLFAASTGFSGYTPVDGDVTLDGTSVKWDEAHTISNGISSVNVVSDVTSIIKEKVDAAPAGDVEFTAAEPTNTGSIDGEILAVVLNDPTVTKSGSVTLLYGAQKTTGDTFHVGLGEPIDKSKAGFDLNLSLGISFGDQPSGQFSTVKVNEKLMTSSAGGQDDGEQGQKNELGENGELITAGGIGDLNDNPPEPEATDQTCMGAFGPAPRCDDELYSLLPFVSNGDTSLTFETANPSNDDNIFFAALDVRGGASVVGEGIVLGPAEATNEIGESHTVTATVQDTEGKPVAGKTVTFEVISGPNKGTKGSAVTDENGEAKFTYTSATEGVDHITASFSNSKAETQVSNEVTKTWVKEGGPPPGTTLTTELSSEGQSGASITVKEGAGVTDTATLSGTNAATATGTVAYTVYSDSACTNEVASAGTVPVSGAAVPASMAETLKPAGTYYWQAAYSGDASNGPSHSECGSEVETVEGPPPPPPCTKAIGAATFKAAGEKAAITNKLYTQPTKKQKQSLVLKWENGANTLKLTRLASARCTVTARNAVFDGLGEATVNGEAGWTVRFKLVLTTKRHRFAVHAKITKPGEETLRVNGAATSVSSEEIS